MRLIPNKLRNQLSKDPAMQVCAVAHMTPGNCSKKIEWHHTFLYAGRQINEAWAIVPACDYHHREVDRNPRIRNEFKRVSLKQATEQDLAKYPNTDWKQVKKYLGVDNWG